MKHRITYLIAVACLSVYASAAAADCTVTYKAKQDSPLRLEHGTMTVTGPCSSGAATDKVRAKLSARGWTLLKVLSISGS